MSEIKNVVQIKRGPGKPSDGILMPYELGYDKTNTRLYIGDEDRKAINLTPEKVVSAINADQLSTARNIQTNLGSTAAASFNGTENVAPGVSGVLSLANGGLGVNASTDTGKTTARANLGINLSNLGVTATAAELNVLDGITATTTELNYVDGVTSAIQTQLNSKVPTSRTVNGKPLSANISLTASDVGARSSSWVPTLANLGVSASATELNYVDGVTSAIQTQLNSITTRLGKIKYDQLLAENSSVSSCKWTGTYDLIIGMATSGSAVDSRTTFILPYSFLGSANSFQVSDESYWTSFNTTAKSITRKDGYSGVLKCLYGIRIV